MIKKEPLVSIIMAVYNDEFFLKSVVGSIIDQTYKNIEIIIVDDCSTDKSSSLLLNLKKIDKRIKLIKNKNNIGLTKSLNRGILKAKGKYVARQDADDFSYKKRIELQVNFLENNKNYIMCGTQRVIINKINSKKYRDFLPVNVNDIRSQALFKNPFFHSSIMINKKILIKEGLYNENFKYIQDLELWSRLIFKYKCTNLNKILCKKYIDQNRISFNKKITFKRKYCLFFAKINVYKNGNYKLSELFKMILILLGFIKYNEN